MFTDKFLGRLAHSTGFITRTRKITALRFIQILLFNTLSQEKQSLVDMKCDYIDVAGDSISTVAIHKKFTNKAVQYLKALLDELILSTLPSDENTMDAHKHFSCISIKDSSKFKLPISYIKDYPGYGSFGKNIALMNLQFEYDLLKGCWHSIGLTQATRNDQAESKETIHDIRPKGLYIRDLGYITTGYLKGIIHKKAFFLNRLPKIGVYTLCEDQYILLDWKDLDNQIKENAREFHELNVYLGKDKIPCRMVITPVPSKIAEERVRKAKQRGKRKNGYQLSKEYRIKANYNIYITNVRQEVLSAQQIIETYRLRWQIELIFKTWKSNLDIHKIKPVKTPRMECQLLAKLIWILINTKLHHICNMLLSQNQSGAGCSIFKFMKYATKFFRSLISSICDLPKLLAWFNTVISPVLEDLKIDRRLKKNTHCQILNSIS